MPIALRTPIFLTTAAGIAGAALIGYSIYFDRKRRAAPDYKQKIRERRKLQQKRETNPSKNLFPDPRDRRAMEQFLFSELTLGEELLNSGQKEEGVFHMANAVIVSDHPTEFLQIFQQTLPPQHFSALVEALPSAKARLSAAAKECCAPDALNLDENERQRVFVVDDDLE